MHAENKLKLQTMGSQINKTETWGGRDKTLKFLLSWSFYVRYITHISIAETQKEDGPIHCHCQCDGNVYFEY